jgi:hypothetical protein
MHDLLARQQRGSRQDAEQEYGHPKRVLKIPGSAFHGHSEAAFVAQTLSEFCNDCICPLYRSLLLPYDSPQSQTTQGNQQGPGNLRYAASGH